MIAQAVNVEPGHEHPAPSPESRLGTVVLAAAFPLFSLLLYLPVTLYLTNADEFTLRLDDVGWLLVPAWIVSAGCAAALLAWLPARARGRVVSVALALGLLLWLQGSLLVWQYGVLDGSDIEWENFRRNGLVDTPIWLLVLAAAVLAPARFVKVARPAAAIVMIVQSAMLLTSVVNAAPDEPSGPTYAIDDAPKYSFSPQRNVIVFVLDTFQSDVFAEIVSAKPEYAEQLDGFTYFPDAVAASNYTELAVPALLTGRVYDNGRPRDAFMREAFVEHGLTAELKRAGYAVDVYPWAEYARIPMEEAVATNLELSDGQEDAATFTEKKLREALRLIDLAIFRAAPHFLKRYVFFSHRRGPATLAVRLLVPRRVKGAVSSADEYGIATFMASAPPSLPLDRGAPTFKFYHLKGPHVPLVVDENLSFNGPPREFSRHNYRLQAEANLLYLGKFFAELEEAGIYDETLILVLGDHGSGENDEMYIAADEAPERLEGTTRDFAPDKARGIPLVLVKRIGAEGPLEVSAAPVSLLDVPATVLAELGLDRGGRGRSMFEWAPDARRVRHYAAFEVGPSSSDFVDDITLYRIDGHSWRNESWSVAKILPPATERAAD